MLLEMSHQKQPENRDRPNLEINLGNDELKKVKRADELELIEIPILQDRVRLK